MDKWNAECVPCKWLDLHDTEDAAIKAAENHVRRLHADVPPAKRGDLMIGHVQLRTMVTSAEATSPAPSPAPAENGDSSESATGQTSPATEQPGGITIETPKGETITVKE